MLSAELLEILACPNCHATFAYDPERDELVCTDPQCALAYPIVDQIPILLIDEARPTGDQAPRRRRSHG